MTFINHQARSMAAVLYWLNFILVNNLGKSKKDLNKFIKYFSVSFLILFVFIFFSELVNFFLLEVILMSIYIIRLFIILFIHRVYSQF